MSARKPTLSQSVLLNTTTWCFPAKYTAKRHVCEAKRS